MRHTLHHLLVLLCAFLPLSLCAQTMQTKAPRSVNLSGTIRLQYVVNGASSADFTTPSGLSKDFEVLSGPATSSYSSYQMVGGRTSSQQSVTYTFILAPKHAGNFQIPGATARVGGKVIRSASTPIAVTGTGKSAASSPGTQRRPKSADEEDDYGQMRNSGTSVTNKDLFFTVEPSKRSVYEQEPIMLTYKFHSIVDMGRINVMLKQRPDLKGFWTQEIELPRNITPQIERRGGKAYRTGTNLQYFLYPQQTGRLMIPGITFDVEYLQRNASVDIIDAFFNGQTATAAHALRRVPDISINVLPLPTPKPADFSGGVGSSINVMAKLLTPSPATNDIATLRISISGNGNLKLLKAPVVKFPKDFDTFEPKMTDKTSIGVNGITGAVYFDYTFVPRNVGKYDIPPISFVYFDTETRQYKTLQTAPIHLDVKQGKRSAEDVDRELQLLASDIHDIHPCDAHTTAFMPNGMLWWGTWPFFITIVVILLAFVCLYLWLRPFIAQHADAEGMRLRRANRRASKLLREAKAQMDSKDATTYYAALEDALHGFLTDKLALPRTATAETIITTMRDKGIDEALIEEAKSIMEECDFARYAPTSDTTMRQTIWEKASKVITDMQQHLRMLILIAIVVPCALSAAVVPADSAYKARDYMLAAKRYEQMCKSTPNADLYYNCGNAYYKLGKYPQAVLAYERALKMCPEHSDAAYNLQLVRTRLVDKWADPSEMFFVTLWRNIWQSYGVKTWTIWALLSLIGTLAMLMLYLLSRRVVVRKLSFALCLLLALLCIITNTYAALARQRYRDEVRGVVVVPTVKTYLSPNTTAKAGRTLHEGTTVVKTDNYGADWWQVTCPDGTEVWLDKKALEQV